MKSPSLLLAAFLGVATAASAQTAIPQTAPNTTNSASPDAVPSGMPPSTTTNSVGGVSAGEVFTKGDPSSQKMQERRAMKRSKKNSMDSQGKMKTKM